MARRGSEANRNEDEDNGNDDHDPFVVIDADEAMANAERDLKADAEWKRIQQNTFTRWANEHLKQADKQVTTYLHYLLSYFLKYGSIPASFSLILVLFSFQFQFQ